MNTDENNANNNTPEIMEDMSYHNVQMAILGAGNGKAPGPDEIPKEFLDFKSEKEPGEPPRIKTEIVEAVRKIFTTVAQSGKIPTVWKEANIVPIYKGKGDRLTPKNYRPISLLCHMRKMFEHILATRINSLGVHRAQGGFQTHRSTLDQVIVLDHACRIARRKKKNIFIAFLDIEGAYDTVDRDTLLHLLEAKGLDQSYLRVAKEMLSTTSRVVGDGHRSRTFQTTGGLPQGGALSPALYNQYIDELFYLLDECPDSRASLLRTEDRNCISSLGFADDLALIATDITTLQKLVDICAQFARNRRFRWNVSKCKVIGTNMITLEGSFLAQVQSFRYLGIYLNKNGICQDDATQTTLDKINSTSLQISDMGINAKGINLTKSIQAWKTFTRSICEYGLQIIMSIPEELEKAFNMSVVKGLGLGGCTSREVSRLIANCTDLETRRLELQATYIMRIFRFWPNENTLLGACLNDMVNDSDSIIRRAISSNKLLAEAIGNHRIGTEIQALWSETEIAQSHFGGSRYMAWTRGQVERTPFNADAISLKNRRKFRLTRLNERLQRYCDSEQTLLRQFPRIWAGINWTKQLPPNIDRATERIFLQWIAGGMPRKREERLCRVCSNPIESPGSRKHVAQCAGISPLPHTNQAATWLDNNITNNELDAMTVKIGQYANAHRTIKPRIWQELERDLQKIATMCLGRELTNLHEEDRT
jgi:sarcosine oxidase/L-pipecolate oxidase